MSAGKGDKWRETDFKKYFNNFDGIKFTHAKKKQKKISNKKSKPS